MSSLFILKFFIQQAHARRAGDHDDHQVSCSLLLDTARGDRERQSLSRLNAAAWPPAAPAMRPRLSICLSVFNSSFSSSKHQHRFRKKQANITRFAWSRVQRALLALRAELRASVGQLPSSASSQQPFSNNFIQQLKQASKWIDRSTNAHNLTLLNYLSEKKSNIFIKKKIIHF